MSPRSALVSVASTSASSLPPEVLLARWLWWRGKPMRPAYWRRAWTKKLWIQRLCSRISWPSMAAPGVESWIASLRGCRASRTLLLESAWATRTNARSGRTSSGSSKRRNQLWLFSRTSPDSSSSSDPSTTSFDNWASSCLRHCYTRPRNSGRRTTGDDSLSSLPTPRASDGEKAGPNMRGTKGDLMLPSLVAALPTPTATSYGNNRGGSAGRTGPVRESLERVVNSLPTPTAGDARASGAAGYSKSGGRHSGTTLSDAVTGAASPGRRGKLNPRLSAWLQDLPPTWTRLEPSGTASFRSWLRKRSARFSQS